MMMTTMMTITYLYRPILAKLWVRLFKELPRNRENCTRTTAIQ